jgi:H+-transporting ATPase
MVHVAVDSAIPAAGGRPKSALHEAMALHESEKAGPKDPVDVEKLTDLVELSSGFAQMLPEHKYIVVDLLQARGHIVAMTGDGVNDAPALKRADVGVAVSGATDAARMAASLVLQEPGLNVIVEAIRESRRIFARMESYVLYRINATLELLFFLVLSACILNFKLSGIQIVFLVLVNDITVMLIAIDHVAVQPLPQHWNLKYLTSIASFIGAFSVAIVMTTLVVMMNYYGVPATQMTSLMFLQLSITDQLTILSTRTRGIFFVSMPHWMLLSACILTQILFTLFVLFGVAMPAADGNLVGIIWGISMGSLIVKDFAKVCMTFLMDRILGIKHGVWFEPSCEGISCIKCSKD